MKLFAFIMACAVLTLSCMPCFDVCTQTAKTEFSKTDSEQGSNHNDVCSPFCYCSCCAGFSMNHFITFISNPSINRSKDFNSYLSQDIIEVSIPVWQPPRA